MSKAYSRDFSKTKQHITIYSPAVVNSFHIVLCEVDWAQSFRCYTSRCVSDLFSHLRLQWHYSHTVLIVIQPTEGTIQGHGITFHDFFGWWNSKHIWFLCWNKLFSLHSFYPFHPFASFMALVFCHLPRILLDFVQLGNIVWLHHSVGHFWWRNHWESLHNTSAAKQACACAGREMLFIRIFVAVECKTKTLKFPKFNKHISIQDQTRNIRAPRKLTTYHDVSFLSVRWFLTFFHVACALPDPFISTFTASNPSFRSRFSKRRSGYSSLTFEISKVPMPAPVPPPKEWHNWKPCKQSQPGRRKCMEMDGFISNEGPARLHWLEIAFSFKRGMS